MQQTRFHNDELGSGSGSGYSDLSALENETDTLGRAIIKHERDARRIQAVLHGTSRPFNKAIPRASVSQRLQRIGALEKETRIPLVEKKEQDVPMGTTRAWGRRQRPERNWTRHEDFVRNGDSDGSGSRHKAPSTEDDDAIVPHRTAYTGDHYLDNAGRFTSLGEDTPPSMKRNQSFHEPSSMHHMNSSIVESAGGDVLRTAVYSARTRTGARSPRDHRQAHSVASLRSEAPTQPLYDLDDDKENMPDAFRKLPADNRGTMQPRHSALLSAESSTPNAHVRNDSMQLLKRLARVSSMSPSPARPVDEPAIPNEQPGKQPDTGVQRVQNSLHPAQFDAIPATPIVTGGWVDTPKQDRKVETYKSGDEKAPQANQVDNSPQKHLQTTSEDNSTSASREQVDTKQNTDDDTRTASMSQRVATGPEDSRSPQHNSLQTLAGLVTEQSTIARAVSAATTAFQPSERSSGHANTTRPRRHVSFDLNGRTVCEHCGGGYANAWEALWVELRSNFYVHDPDSYANVHLTWLGAAVLAWACWYMLENTLCNWYCKPLFALDMDGYGANMFAPRYPLVIPSLLLRPFESAWQPITTWLTWLSGVAFHWIFGEGARDYTIPARLSQANHPPNALKMGAINAAKSLQPASWTGNIATVAVTTSQRAIASTVDAIDDIGRMWNGDAFG